MDNFFIYDLLNEDYKMKELGFDPDSAETPKEEEKGQVYDENSDKNQVMT